MKQLSKVVWYEGMYLGPHHFQVQTQSFEDLVHFSTSCLWFAPYGLASYKLEVDALKNGLVSLVHARGLFPDGLAFQMPDADPLPPILNINELFSSTRESMTVLLSVPARRPGGPNCSLDSDPARMDLRYQAESRILPDANSGQDEQRIQIGRKNIRFVPENHADKDLVTLPVARVQRDGAGHFIFDPAFIPPCLQISASERLLVLARTLVDILSEKSASLSRARRASGQGRAGYSSDEIASFWFVHTVNQSLSVLRHLYISERVHPEQLYLEMARLAGALCTFGLESHPDTLPVYDHDKLDVCFARSTLISELISNWSWRRTACIFHWQSPDAISGAEMLPISGASTGLAGFLGFAPRRGSRDHCEGTSPREALLKRVIVGTREDGGIPGLGLTHCPSLHPRSPRKLNFSISVLVVPAIAGNTLFRRGESAFMSRMNCQVRKLKSS